VEIHDPWADRDEARHEFGSDLLVETPTTGSYNAIVIAVAHDQFRSLGIDGLRRFGRPGAVVYDIKGIFPMDAVDARL
jgi:UDP-N-acetyl-D-galactosamine dehydrogenase